MDSGGIATHGEGWTVTHACRSLHCPLDSLVAMAGPESAGLPSSRPDAEVYSSEIMMPSVSAWSCQESSQPSQPFLTRTLSIHNDSRAGIAPLQSMDYPDPLYVHQPSSGSFHRAAHN